MKRDFEGVLFVRRVDFVFQGIFSGTSLEQMLSLCVSYVKEPSGARKSTVSGLTALLSLIQNADIREVHSLSLLC